MKSRDKLIKFGIENEFDQWKENFLNRTFYVGDKVKFIKPFNQGSHIACGKIPAGRTGVVTEVGNSYTRIKLSARVKELDGWENILHMDNYLNPETLIRRVR